jgi:hypothetical protein
MLGVVGTVLLLVVSLGLLFDCLDAAEDEETPGTRRREGGSGAAAAPWKEPSSWEGLARGLASVAPSLCFALREEKAREVCRART